MSSVEAASKVLNTIFVEARCKATVVISVVAILITTVDVCSGFYLQQLKSLRLQRVYYLQSFLNCIRVESSHAYRSISAELISRRKWSRVVSKLTHLNKRKLGVNTTPVQNDGLCFLCSKMTKVSSLSNVLFSLGSDNKKS